jgi:hypothetical protein
MSIIFSPNLVIQDVSGGGTVDGNNPVIGWNSYVTNSNISSTTAIGDSPVTNLVNPATYNVWSGTSMVADEYVTMNLATSDFLDYVGIASHNFFSAGIAVSLEVLIGGVTWTEIIAPFVPSDDNSLMFRFPLQGIDKIRIRMQPGTSVPRMSVVYVGRLLVIQRRLYVGHQPMTLNRITNISNGRSETGNFLGRVVKNKMIKTSVALDHITADFMREQLDPFFRVAQEIPFFWAWRPFDYPKEVAYAWMSNDVSVSNSMSNGMMKVGWDMAGIAA